MNMYTPDRWVLLEFENMETGNTITKVFGGWYGGFADGDSWKLSSGVIGSEDRDDYWEFTNHSGSVYRCYKRSQGMSGHMSSVYSTFVNDANKTGKYNVRTLSM